MTRWVAFLHGRNVVHGDECTFVPAEAGLGPVQFLLHDGMAVEV